MSTLEIKDVNSIGTPYYFTLAIKLLAYVFDPHLFT